MCSRWMIFKLNYKHLQSSTIFLKTYWKVWCFFDYEWTVDFLVESWLRIILVEGNLFSVNFLLKTFISNLQISKVLLSGNIFFPKSIVSGANEQWEFYLINIWVTFMINCESNYTYSSNIKYFQSYFEQCGFVCLYS